MLPPLRISVDSMSCPRELSGEFFIFYLSEDSSCCRYLKLIQIGLLKGNFTGSGTGK